MSVFGRAWEFGILVGVIAFTLALHHVRFGYCLSGCVSLILVSGILDFVLVKKVGLVAARTVVFVAICCYMLMAYTLCVMTHIATHTTRL